jgi:hypothetical protein
LKAIVVVGAAGVGTERWLHGGYLHGASTRASYFLLAFAIRFGELISGN